MFNALLLILAASICIQCWGIAILIAMDTDGKELNMFRNKAIFKRRKNVRRD